MRSRLLQIIAALLLIAPFAAFATPDVYAASGSESIDGRSVTKRRCLNISKCQIFTPWARNPYINRVYLAQGDKADSPRTDIGKTPNKSS